MKTMKHTMKCLIAVITMVMVFTVTGITAQAEKVTRSNEKLDFDGFVKTEINNIGSVNDKLSNIGYYQGGYVTNLQQIGATVTSITISWTPVEGAVAYYITDTAGYNSGIYYYETTSNTYTINFNSPDNGGTLIVMPVDANGIVGSYSYCDSVTVRTLPQKITGVKYNGAFAASNKLAVMWNDSIVAEGFDIVCYKKNGKVVQTNNEMYYRDTTFSKSNTKNIYYVVVKPYIMIKNGTEKLYGESSNKFYAVPQPQITSKNKDIKVNSFNLKWKKVDGATKYEIYVSTKEKSGYKKVATVKKSAKSYKITKYKGKTINTLNKTHYAKIVTVAKFGKKTVKSGKTHCISFYSYYR